MKRYLFTFIVSLSVLLAGCNNTDKSVVSSDRPSLETYYSVDWRNYDGTLLETDSVKEGEIPEYNGDTPTRESDDYHDYSFSGWTPEVGRIYRGTTYTATYKETDRFYTVTWVNYDGEVLEVDENVKAGTIPQYDGEAPSKPYTSTHEYIFNGWSPALEEVTKDITYTASYIENQYELFTYELSEDSQYYSVTGINGDYYKYFPEDGELTIPSTYNGLPVKKIGNSAFMTIYKLKAITIPDSINSIGSYAFSRTLLTSFTFNSNITEISNGLFFECTELKSVTFSSNITSIGSAAFKRTGLTGTITIPSTVTSIGEEAFMLNGISELDLSHASVSIGPSAFENCYLKKVSNSENITKISYRSFYGCSLLETITLPETLKEIGDSAFMYCNKINKSVKSLPVFLEVVGNNAFYNYNLQLNTLPTGLRRIGKLAFFVSKITNLVINSSVTYISEGAFDGCEFDHFTLIGSDELIIEKNAFPNSTDIYLEDGGNTYIKSSTNDHYYLSKATSISINANTKHIGPAAFKDNTDIAAIIIPNSVIAIWDDAFRGCTKLETIEYGTGLKTIGSYAFYGTIQHGASLTSTQLTKIGKSAFEGVGNRLSTYYYRLPDTLTYIGDSAFKDTYASVSIPNNLQYIGEQAYYSAYFVSSITYFIPESVNYIGYGAFRRRTTYIDFYIPSTVTNIKSGAFSDSYITAYCESETKPESWENGWSGSAKVYWNKSKVTGIEISQTELNLAVGESIVLTACVLPTNAYDTTFWWKSNDTNVVTVNNGLIKAIGTGTTTVQVKANGGNYYAYCSVTVS